MPVGPRGLVIGGVSRLSSTLLSCSYPSRSEHFRCDPLSGQTRVSLAVDLRRDCSRKSRRAEARLCLCSSRSDLTVIRRLRCILLLASPPRPSRFGLLAQPLQAHSANGSLRRLPIHARAAVPRHLAASRPDRPGLPPPARLAAWICRPCFMPERPWAPYLQRLLSALAALPSRAALSSLPFPALRRRGFEDLSRSAVAVASTPASRQPYGPSTPCGASSRRERMRSPPSTLFTPAVGSLLSWLFSPFEDDLPALPRTSAGLLSWASIVQPRPRLALRSASGPTGRALFRVSKNRKNRPLTRDAWQARQLEP